MKGEQKFFICKTCGNQVGMILSGGVPMECCGEPMTELIPGSIEASLEKHIPVAVVTGDRVKVIVGSVEHPMIPEHYIEWIYLQTENGGQRKSLVAGMPPVAEFALVGDRAVAVFAYCNLHGLWKADL